ncbi:MAG: hypothetical protein ABI024_11755 [Vicinamibacterales bacterium]
MRSRRLLAFVVLAMLACARPADAGWLDIIWEMTGPRMIGIGGECEIAIARNPDKGCILPFARFPRAQAPKEQWFYLSTEAFYYFSVPHNGFSTGEVQGFGVDPMVLFSRINASNTVRVTSGVGLSFQRFWSDDVDAFGNSGLKVRPLAVEFPLGVKKARVNLAYNLRYYWDGFEARPAVEGTRRIPAVFRKVDQPETVHGLTIAFTF